MSDTTKSPKEAAAEEIVYDESVCSAEFSEGCTETVKEREVD